MALALVRKSTLAILNEATYGTMPTITAAHVLATWGSPSFNHAYEQVQDGTVRNTLSKWGNIRGMETISGDISVPFKGSGTGGTAPDSDVLWECAVGVKNTSTASTVVTPNTGVTTTNIILTASGGAGFAVGDAVKIGSDIAWITAKATDTLTVSPALSAIPAAGTAVKAGVHYKLSDTTKSFAAKFWRGDITREDYTGFVVESFDIDFSTGQIPVPKFSFQGKAMLTPVAEACPLTGISLDATTPVVARSMVVTVGATSYPVSNIALSIKNDLYRKLDVTSSGTNEIIKTGRSVTGSFSLLYADKTVEDAFEADTAASLRVVCGTADGNTFAFRILNMRYIEVPKSEDNGCYKYDISFEADPSVGGDEITSVSWL